MIDHFDVILVLAPPDDELRREVDHFLHSMGAAFDFLSAVIDARFAVIRSGLDMTRKVIG